MTDAPNDGGHAFPMASDLLGHTPGMSLRDWFAGQALASLLADYDSRHGIPPYDFMRHCAAAAYKVADAMIAARDKTGAA